MEKENAMDSAKPSRKLRRIAAVGLLCLSVGLMLPYFSHPTSAAGLDWLHFFRGLLIGLSLGISIFSLIRMRQSRPGERQESLTGN
jgi:hypothetical protein